MDYLKLYYGDNCAYMHDLCKRVLAKLQIPWDDEYLGIADFVMADLVERFKTKPDDYDFDRYFMMCFSNKVKTDLTTRNREKRKSNMNAVPLETHIENAEGLTLGDVIPDPDSSVEDIVFPKKNELQERVQKYLDNLSKTERKIADLIMDGMSLQDIPNELGITKSTFNEIMTRMRSYEYTKCLAIYK